MSNERNPFNEEPLDEQGASERRASAADKVMRSIDPSKPGGIDPAKAVLGTTETGRKVADTMAKVEKAKNATIAAVEGTKATVSAVVPVVTNWVFWVVVAVVILLVIISTGIIAFSQTFGRNENADGCLQPSSSGATVGVNVVASADKISTANSITGWFTTTSFDFLGGKPMTVDQSYAIIGNWVQESSLNPGIVQGGGYSSTDSNETIAGISGGGKAVGLAQWDGGRRANLANFASSNGGHWADINMQLSFLKSELESSEGRNLVAGGFNDATKSLDQLVVIFEERFERAGVPRVENRIAAANEYKARYNGGYSSATGGSCLTALNGVGSGNVVDLAISLAWPTLAESRVGGDTWGSSRAKPEYKQAKEQAMSQTGADPASGLYASCDRFVATIIRLTQDPNIPWGSTREQYTYLDASPLWQPYTNQAEAQPGDIWITKRPGHVLLYLGNVDGRDTIADASYLERVGALHSASYVTNMRDTSGREYVGFRFIGGNQGASPADLASSFQAPTIASTDVTITPLQEELSLPIAETYLTRPEDNS